MSWNDSCCKKGSWRTKHNLCWSRMPHSILWFHFQTKWNIISEEIASVLIQTQASELWKIISENLEDEEVKDLLDEMMNQIHTWFKIVDVLQEFYLKKLHKHPKLPELSLGQLQQLLWFWWLRQFCILTENVRSLIMSAPPRMNVKFTDLLNNSYEAALERKPKEPIAVATKITTKTKKENSFQT